MALQSAATGTAAGVVRAEAGRSLAIYDVLAGVASDPHARGSRGGGRSQLAADQHLCAKNSSDVDADGSISYATTAAAATSSPTRRLESPVRREARGAARPSVASVARWHDSIPQARMFYPHIDPGQSPLSDSPPSMAVVPGGGDVMGELLDQSAPTSASRFLGALPVDR